MTSWDGFVPEESHRQTRNDASDTSPETIQCNDGDYNPADTSRCTDEKALILKQNGKFGEAKTGIVYNHTCPERL